MPPAARPNPAIRRWDRWLVAGLALVVGLHSAGQPTRAQGRAMPQAPESKPQLFDPDPATCRPETIRAAFQRQLEPYADQGAAVVQRLKAVQAEMTLSSLRRCVRRGLMSEQEALGLGRELGLIAPTATGAAQGGAGPSTRP